MNARLVFHLEQLSRLGANRISHKNGTLLQHLEGTWSLLRDWGNPVAVCLAGLYHSVYGTGGFEQQSVPLSDRERIIKLIGTEAEQLVYLFGACDRPLTHPRIGVVQPMLFHDRFTDQDYPLEDNQWRAQCEIMLANEVDLGLHNPDFYRKHLDDYHDLFGRFKPWLSDAAMSAHQLLAERIQ
mgnify:FL=1